MEAGHMHKITPDIAREIREIREARLEKLGDKFGNLWRISEQLSVAAKQRITAEWLAKVESGVVTRINSRRASALVEVLGKDFWGREADLSRTLTRAPRRRIWFRRLLNGWLDRFGSPTPPEPTTLPAMPRKEG